jgi:hypothetical protein
MSRQSRSQLALGIILILLGAWFLAERTIPSLSAFADQYFKWPFTLVWIGALILLIGLLTGNPGMAVPAAIVAGIGGIFYYNDSFAGGQGAWSYMWTLIPGFVGIGSIIAGLLGDNPRQNLRHGFNTLIFSAVAFLVFASIFGGLELLGKFGAAILLIVFGLWLLGKSLWKTFSKKGDDNVQTN